jgi:hypothetical protein
MRIKLVVLDGHTLGYIFPNFPNYVQVLHSSILKGAPRTTQQPENFLINKNSNIRLASRVDFEEFRCVFGSFANKKEYEYAE